MKYKLFQRKVEVIESFLTLSLPPKRILPLVLRTVRPKLVSGAGRINT